MLTSYAPEPSVDFTSLAAGADSDDADSPLALSSSLLSKYLNLEPPLAECSAHAVNQLQPSLDPETLGSGAPISFFAKVPPAAIEPKGPAVALQKTARAS